MNTLGRAGLLCGAALLQLACGCGDEAATRPKEEDPMASAGSGAGTGSTTSAAGSAGATPSAGAGGTEPLPSGAAAPDTSMDAGEDASDPPMDEPVSAKTLLPLTVGNRWTFQVTGTSSVCVAGIRISQVAENPEPTDPPSVLIGSYCRDGDSRPVRVGDDGIEQRAGDDWGLTLGDPVEEGSTWSYVGSMQFSWHRVGSVTVPAGTFDECWERLAVGSSIYTTTYCHQIGPVRVADDDFTGELSALELRTAGGSNDGG